MNTQTQFESLENRRLMSTVSVAVKAVDAIATEGNGSDAATFVVSRSQALPTPTKVYFSIGGTARDIRATPTSSIDYDAFTMTIPQPSGTPTLTTRMGNTPYVVIPAGWTSNTVTVVARDDAAVEMTETATFTIVPGGAYTVSNVPSATLYLKDNDNLSEYHVNFQTAGVASPAGYIADTGRVFAERAPGYTFGWNFDNTANARVRNNPQSPDARYDSFNQLPFGMGRKWEIAVPNGTYQVRVVTGDADSATGTDGIWIEDQLTAGGRSSGLMRFSRTTGVVSIADGRLTLLGALGTTSNRIDSIDIKRLPLRSVLGPIATVSAPLKTPETAGWWHQRPDGLFSDNQIDHALWA